METGGLIYLASCALIFAYLSKDRPIRIRPMGWRMELATVGARALLALVIIPVTIVVCAEWLLGVRVLQVRQRP